MNETINWIPVTEDEPPIEEGVLLCLDGEVYWGDWDGQNWTCAATGRKEIPDYWASVKGIK